MNKIQKTCLWLGVILFVLIGLNSLIWQRADDTDDIGEFPRLFAYWVMIAVVTLGFMYTFKSEKKPLNSSPQTSLETGEKKKEPRSLWIGFRRMVFVFSLIPVMVGIIFAVVSLTDDSKDMILAGVLIAVLGFITIWSIHIAVLFIVEGFRTKTCACCGKNIDKLADSFIHKRHILCLDCYGVLGDKAKLEENQCSR